MVSEHIEISKNKKIPDFIKSEGYYLIFCLLIISFVLYFAYSPVRQGNYTYTVTESNGTEIKLLTPQVKPLTVKGRLGNIILEWRADGSVRIASSTCPLKICMHQGWVKGNDSLVCVPNAVVVSCHSSIKTNVDGVSY